MKQRGRVTLPLMTLAQIPLGTFGRVSARFLVVFLSTRDRNSSGAKAIARPHSSPVEVTKTVGEFGPSSIDLEGNAWDCWLQPELRGEFLPPQSSIEIPSSHVELPEGDEVMLFNDQLASVRGIGFSRRLKNLAASAGASSERQISTAGPSTSKRNVWSHMLSMGRKFSDSSCHIVLFYTGV